MKKGKHSEKKKQKKKSLCTGTFTGHPKGFGFVKLDNTEEEIYIPEEDTLGALYQDRVRVELTASKKEGKRQEGIIREILSRGTSEIIGTYQSC